MGWSRRRFLTYLGLGTYAALRDPLGVPIPPASASPPRGRRRPDFFDPIEPSTADELLLPAGYRYDLVCAWGDELGSAIPAGLPGPHEELAGREERFGCNNDFLAYFPIDALGGGGNLQEGLLWVNHEYPNPVFVSGYTPADYKAGREKQRRQILDEKLSVGGSVLYVRRGADGRWTSANHPRFTRRFTALYPEMQVSGPAREAVLEARPDRKCFGTLANCSGGRTPWHTVLSCEENYPDYNESRTGKIGYRWTDQGEAIAEDQFGWVVEVDPFGELPPTKHTSLGRFKHENAAVRLDGAGRRLVVYMGDDEPDQFLYKFVAAEPYDPAASRAAKSRLLTRGTLYAADFAHGRWLALDWDRNRKCLADWVQGQRLLGGNAPEFTSQADVLMRTREAARALGATPLDRPEDCEVHPLDGSLYVALTNNTKRDDFYGRIVRLIEDQDDPEGQSFRFEIFLAGGPDSGLACPDNLAFDKQGNLWVACDISSPSLRKAPYEPFGNNGLFVVPTAGPGAGDAYQFASGPVQCELTGPWFLEDGQTLFLSVQHPGEESQRPDQPTSRWPGRKEGDPPRPAVVAITGFRW